MEVAYERLIKKGAEAEIWLGEWLGLKVVVKRRVPKPYRRPDFDLLLRRSRTLREASLMAAARRLAVPAPAVYAVDVEGASLIMEYVQGPTVKDLLLKAPEGLGEVFRVVGASIGRLHAGGVVHGDLTTSNMILSGGRVFLVDFGLGEFSRSHEAMGVDLHLMLRSLESTQPSIAQRLFERALEGYRGVMGDEARAVEERVRLIRMRGRYVEARRLTPRGGL
ncbi:Kae1-associated kinase Bud32 [Candidatus Geothermarchaeota archaeon ex4572_27]|nr:MAG: Kae1-associated kinase Bud32 [Candidatus Geothermarchaeota archaeon ex4572_27]